MLFLVSAANNDSHLLSVSVSLVVSWSSGMGSSRKLLFLELDHALKFLTAHKVLFEVFLGTGHTQTLTGLSFALDLKTEVVC